MATKKKILPIPALWLSGDVDASMTEKVLKFYQNPLIKNMAVIVYLNSEGGEGVQAKEMVRIIKEHGHTTIIAYGDCSSSATLILQAAIHRASTVTCEFLVHYGNEDVSSITERRAFDKELKWMIGLYQEKVTVSKAAVRRWLSKETYMAASRALKVGLIDEVLS